VRIIKTGAFRLRLAIAADHAGFELKQYLLLQLKGSGHDLTDLGTNQPDIPDDYPDYAESLANEVISGKAERGILICGSGVGATVAANKIHGIRAGLCHDIYSAHQGVEHDHMNILVLGSRVIGPELARELVFGFLNARFSQEERHLRRLLKVQRLEERG
jgi:RpiB/LacA/LacB family sugar-phosphate isomerase